MGPKKGRQNKQQMPVSKDTSDESLVNQSDPDPVPEIEAVLDTQEPLVKKKKPYRHGDLTEEEKDTILEFLRSNPMIYNKQLSSYRDTDKKNEMWRELAMDLGRNVEEVTTFYQTARTALSRCKRKFKSGMSTDDFSVTDRAYWDRMQFLLPFIYEVKSRNVASFRAAAARPGVPPCLAPTQPSLELHDEDQPGTESNVAPVSPAGSSEVTSTEKPDKSAIESVLVDFIKSKHQNVSSFALYMDERLQALDPNFRRRAQRRLSEVLDHVELQQEQARPMPSFSDHGPQRWSESERQPSCMGNPSQWQGWQPHPSQWRKPSGTQPSVWASQSTKWVDA